MTRFWDIFFTNPDNGTAVGGWCNFCYGSPYFGGYIMHTNDGGDTWTIQKHDTTIFGFYGIFFTDGNSGTVTGAGGTILHTNDGGATWTKQSSGTTNDLWDVFFSSADTGIIVGGNIEYADSTFGGTILRTTNGGTTWIEQEIPTQNAIYKVYFADDNTGTAVGLGGTILLTITGGASMEKKHMYELTRNN
jgi:photosystem II stability/assembly factor-like uncharacterized protein